MENIKIEQIAKALGTLSTSLAEATESDLGIVILIRKENVGIFIGGDDRVDSEQTTRKLRKVAGHLNTLADNILTGKTKCDGKCYGMNDDGQIVALDGKPHKPTRGGDADPEISLLS